MKPQPKPKKKQKPAAKGKKNFAMMKALITGGKGSY